jgi:hypothetical protein
VYPTHKPQQHTTMDASNEDAEETPAWLSNHNEEASPDWETTPDGADANKKPLRTSITCARVLSCLILAAFIYSTAVQYNDVDKFLWSCYYGLQASLALFFLVRTFWAHRGIEGIIYALGATLVVWSVVMIIVNTLNLKNLLKEGNPDADEREEYIYEITGVSLGCVCALYNSILTFHLAKGAKDSEG